MLPVTASTFQSHQLSGMFRYQPQDRLWYVSAATDSSPSPLQRIQRTSPSVCSPDQEGSGSGISMLPSPSISWGGSWR